MLSDAEARTIAESNWGTGGTHAYKTNRRGAFYFACSGHGGFVIDCAALSDVEAAQLSAFVTFDSYTRYTSGANTRVMFQGRTRGFKMPYDCTQEEGQYVLLEEDCAWALAYVMTGIRRKDDGVEADLAAKSTFDRWYDPTNPAVVESKRRNDMRRNRDPDLIVSASGIDAATVRVTTAAGKEYTVNRESYDWGEPFLSACRIV